ncbi:MAG: hypothetical protein K0R55_2316 [Sporomusa sp.]|nr:hypothetical protein [Sporomusa sp.]
MATNFRVSKKTCKCKCSCMLVELTSNVTGIRGMTFSVDAAGRPELCKEIVFAHLALDFEVGHDE